MTRWIRRLLLLGIVLLVGGALLLYLVANVFFEPQRLVRKLEKRLNCRAHIAQADLSLFSQPARLEIQHLALAQRDDYARQRTPLDERPPLTESEIAIEKLSLSVSFPHLLIGKLHVHELVGSGIDARMIEPEDGDHSLDRLFDKPDRTPKKDRPKDDDAASEDDEDDDSDEDDTIDRLKVPATLRSARIEDMRFVIELIEKKTRLTWSDVHLDLTDVSISPKDLENHNRATIAVNAKLAFDHRETDEHYGQMVLQGLGLVTPVDPETRKLEPSIDFRIDVLPETYVETAPLIDAVVDRLGDLKRFGIGFDRLKIGGHLQEQTLLRATYHDHQITLQKDSTFLFQDFEVALEEGSWYETEDSHHHFMSKLTAGPALTERTLESVDRFLSRKLKFLPPQTFRRVVSKHFVEDGRVAIKLTTKGDIGRPRVHFSEKLPDIDIDSVKDSAEDLIDGLKGLFD